nr:acyltransferase [uncultured Parolsenella sp.]
MGADAGERDVGLDLLRSVAMFAVVAVHAVPYLGAVCGADVTEGLAKLFLLCDPVFFVLSGYFAIRPLKGTLRDYYLGKFVTVVAPIIVYSVVAYAFAARFGYLGALGLDGDASSAVSPAGYLAFASSIISGAWWFVPVLTPMLLGAPFLFVMLEALSDSQLRLLVKVVTALSLWGVACDLVASLSTFGVTWAADLSSVLLHLMPARMEPLFGYPLFFCMGYALRRLGPAASGEARNRALLLGLLFWVGDALLAQFGFERSNPSHLWVFSTVGAFVLAARVHVRGSLATRFTEWTSRRSYSIYLFQAAAVLLVFGRIDLSAFDGAARVCLWLTATFASYVLSWCAASVLDTVLLTPIQRRISRALGIAGARKVSTEAN